MLIGLLLKLLFHCKTKNSDPKTVRPSELKNNSGLRSEKARRWRAPIVKKVQVPTSFFQLRNVPTWANRFFNALMEYASRITFKTDVQRRNCLGTVAAKITNAIRYPIKILIPTCRKNMQMTVRTRKISCSSMCILFCRTSSSSTARSEGERRARG